MKYDNPNDALIDLGEKLRAVEIESDQTELLGRVLGQPISADRDSPAADVSAMDGYAIRQSDLATTDPLPVRGECKPGEPPTPMPDSGVVRVFTGAIVPSDCDAVIKREDTKEMESEIRLLSDTANTAQGLHIRRAGENAKKGSTVLSPGLEIHAAHRATMANFGCASADLFRQVRVSILTTGDEVGVFDAAQPEPWQLRNSNRDALVALLKPRPWISITSLEHAIDDRTSLTEMLQRLLSSSDAIIMTGGVSMGDYDYVPDVIRDVGGDVVFHGLPIRPGKPVLGAATDDGKLLMGLPGNPVSATIGCQRLTMPLLARLAGITSWLPHPTVVRLNDAGEKTIPLHWMRLVRMVDHGVCVPVFSQGSGDLVSLGQSDGFVELTPKSSGEGPWPFYGWY